MSGASLSGIHAQAARLAAIANSVASGESEVPDPGTQPQGQLAVAAPDLASDMVELSEAELAYKANAAAFDAGADIWDVLSLIQRD